jgi:hypothetical protein
MALFPSIRRWLVVGLLAIWWGGFTFYTLVVIPSGHQVLHSRLRQGFITQRVTRKLNWLGVVTLAMALTEVLAARSQPKRFRLLLGGWLVCVLTQIALFNLHARMDSLLDAAGMTITDEARFQTLHEYYLWPSSIGWLAAAVILATIGSPLKPKSQIAN